MKSQPTAVRKLIRTTEKYMSHFSFFFSRKPKPAHWSSKRNWSHRKEMVTDTEDPQTDTFCWGVKNKCKLCIFELINE